MIYFKQLLLILLVSFCNNSIAQTKKKIEIQNADGLYVDENVSSGAKRLVGNVVLLHDGATMYCDSALFYDVSNSVEAFGKVHIKNGDSTHVYGDKLYYDGNTKKAILTNNVKLFDRDINLTTNLLNYNVKDNIGYYTTSGIIINKQNKLTSQNGYYYGKKRELFFKDNVKLINKDYTVTTDTMRYHTPTKVAYFFGKTNIKSDENHIYCQNGWYDTEHDKAQFSKHAKLNNKEQTLTGDSVHYDRNLGVGKAFRNVSITDTSQHITINGNYAWFNEKKNKALVTGKALLIQQFGGKDSLFLHADTLRMVYDTINMNNKTIWAYHKAKFFKTDMQGACDSLVYSFKDSLIRMYKAPLLWSGERQLSADTIQIRTFEGKIERLYMRSNAFIINEKDTDKYDQVSAKNMVGNFSNNDLNNVRCIGNGETVYYAKEDKNDKYTGANKAECAQMIIYMKENEVQRINFINKPTATLYPIKEAKGEAFKLKNFNWQIKRRPINANDVFEY
jgi:lipopolysaccharide assembly outer membrane protein LptD (OstA)